MAAGLGFKTFTTGEVLTAADVNGYLMQGVLVFASAAARNAAITSPQEGQFAFTKDVNGLWYYDGAAWVASGATGDIEGVTAGVGISGGGTSGTVTITNSMATAIDAKGDLVAGTAADAFSRLAVGANNTVLTADSAEATGMKWATPAASGSGLTLISSTTIGSGVSSVTVSGAFSATYDAYKITLTGGVASTRFDGLLTLGSTTSGYKWQTFYSSYGAGTTGEGSSGASSFKYVCTGNTVSLAGSMDVINPFLSEETYVFNNYATTTYAGVLSGYLDNSTSYTAFTITPHTGTITGGVIRVYGYANS